MNKSIAVIMTVYNRKDTTLECIRHFYNCTGLKDFDVEFYMMDDGSTDGTSEAVSEAFPQVIILHGDGSLFWNRGMYECWKEAIKKDHDYYLWLNDDTNVKSNCLEILFQTEKSTEKPAVIVGAICSEDGTKATYGGRGKAGIIEPNGKPQEIKEFCGNVVLIPNQVVKQIGINDPYFCHSRGDSEYGFRLVKNGIKILLTSDYVGTCERHDQTMKCFDRSVPLKHRFKFLYSPFGYNPREVYHLERPYKGMLYAIKAILIYHLKVLFP